MLSPRMQEALLQIIRAAVAEAAEAGGGSGRAEMDEPPDHRAGEQDWGLTARTRRAQ